LLSQAGDYAPSNFNHTCYGTKEEREKDYYVSERRYGSFVRSFQVPEGVDTGKIEATFAKGVLNVKLPKTTEAQKSEKTISVKAA
jgi:HSP20 family protein